MHQIFLANLSRGHRYGESRIFHVSTQKLLVTFLETVIPAQAGIHKSLKILANWTPAFAGVTL